MSYYYKFDEYCNCEYSKDMGLNESSFTKVVEDILKTQFSNSDHRKNKIKYIKNQLDKMNYDDIIKIWKSMMAFSNVGR